MKIEAEGLLDHRNAEVDDGGRAMSAEVLLTDPRLPIDEAKGTWLILHSWDEGKDHEIFKKFFGRRVRITMETID